MEVNLPEDSFDILPGLSNNIRRKRYIASYTCSEEDLKQSFDSDGFSLNLEGYFIDNTQNKVYFSMVNNGQKPSFLRNFRNLKLNHFDAWDYRKDLALFKRENPKFSFICLNPKVRKQVRPKVASSLTTFTNPTTIPSETGEQGMSENEEKGLSKDDMCTFVYQGGSVEELIGKIMKLKNGKARALDEFYSIKDMLKKLSFDISQGNDAKGVSESPTSTLTNISSLRKVFITEQGVINRPESHSQQENVQLDKTSHNLPDVQEDVEENKSSTSRSLSIKDYTDPFPSLLLQLNQDPQAIKCQKITQDILTMMNAHIECMPERKHRNKKLMKDFEELSKTLNIYKLVKLYASEGQASYDLYIKKYRKANQGLTQLEILTEFLCQNFQAKEKDKLTSLEKKYKITVNSTQV
jgi:hypothetical protein